MNDQTTVDVTEALEMCPKSPKKILAYCDTGGWVKELKSYGNFVEFVNFPVEQFNKNVNDSSPPSVNSWENFKYWKNDEINKWSNCPYSWGSLGVSDKFNDIRKIFFLIIW